MRARGLWLLLTGTFAASGQIAIVPVKGDRAAQAEAAFERAPSAAPMNCAFKPSPPALNFSLRHDAGYVLTIPLNPERGPSGGIDIYVRLQPAGDGRPVYLASRYDPPAKTESKVEVSIAARFALPPGAWRIGAVATDDAGRACRAEWRAVAKTEPAAMPMNPRSALHRVTIFLSAEPVRRAPGPVGPSDREMLVGSLQALSQTFSSQSARLVVFHFDQRKELLRIDGFEPSALDQVVKAISAVQAGTVDYASLQEPELGSAFLSGLINRELEEPEPADVVIFLGGATASLFPFQRRMIAPGSSPPFVANLQLRPPRHLPPIVPDPALHDRRGAPCRALGSDGPCIGGPRQPTPGPQVRGASAPVPDTISEAVAALRGKTFAVGTPAELARALTQIASRAAGQAKPAK